MDEKEFLMNWIVRYVKNKDLILKKIVDVTLDSGGVSVKNKSGQISRYVVLLSLASLESVVSSQPKDCELCVITINSKDNMNFLVKKWDFAVSNSFLTVIFVNPFSDLDEKWVVKPSIHARICEKKNLARSFSSISETVNLIDDINFKDKVMNYTPHVKSS